MNVKKILLIRAPIGRLPYQMQEKIDIPIGLLYIGASLEKKGHNVVLIDGVMPDGDYKPVHGSENYFGITYEDMEKRIKSFEFDIAAVSAQYSIQFPNVVKMGELLKRINPECSVLIGGAHASVQHREIISQHKCFDVAIRGEGELTVSAVIDALDGKKDLAEIKGITYRNGLNIFSTDDMLPLKELDELPFPAYHLIDMEKYFCLSKNHSSRPEYVFPGCERGVSLITSRGCPYQCSFCSIHLHMGRRWRYHSPEYVLKHMEYLIENYDVRYFHFEDDNLTANPKRFERILDGVMEKKFRIRWDTPNGVRADTLDLDLFKKCRQTGCTYLVLAIESGSQRVLDEVICKKIKLEDIERAAELAKKSEVNTQAFYLIGSPGETKEEIRTTASHALKMINKYDCFGMMQIVVPLFGTKVYEDSVKNGYLLKEMTPENISEGYAIGGMLKTKDFDPEFLRSVCDDFNNRKYLQMQIFLKRILTSPRLFLYCIKKVFTYSPSQWSYVYFRSIYYQIIYCHHSLTWDMENVDSKLINAV